MMAMHRVKSRYGQCQCLWCGRRHGDCRVTTEMRAALREFAEANGRTWKRKLTDAWTRGDDLGAELQQVRNVLGPSGLQKLTTRLVLTGRTWG